MENVYLGDVRFEDAYQYHRRTDVSEKSNISSLGVRSASIVKEHKVPRVLPHADRDSSNLLLNFLCPNYIC